jgi:hypothetical protein
MRAQITLVVLIVSLIPFVSAQCSINFEIRAGDLKPTIDGNRESYDREWDVATTLTDSEGMTTKMMHAAAYLYVLAWSEDVAYNADDFIEICFDKEADSYNTWDADDYCLRVFRDGNLYESSAEEQTDIVDWTGAVGWMPNRKGWVAEYEIAYRKLGLKFHSSKTIPVMLRVWDKDAPSLSVPIPPEGDYRRPMYWCNLTSADNWDVHTSLLNPPSLSSERFAPRSPRYPQKMNFSVVYSDQDGDPPERVVLVLNDREEIEMATNLSACNPKIGCRFTYNGTIEPGRNRFYFKGWNRQDSVMTQEQNFTVRNPVNHPPEITGFTIKPRSGDRYTHFKFGMDYYDADGDLPAYTYLVVGGTDYRMFKEGAGVCSPLEVCRYSATKSFPAWLYDYHFTASDGLAIARSPDFHLMVRGFQTSPELVNGTVTPATGTNTTLFNYTLRYKDLDGEGWGYVNVYIDGEARNMTKVSECNVSFGCDFEYATMLNNGNHSFFFQGGDGRNTTRLPSEGENEGPNVTTVVPLIVKARETNETAQTPAEGGGWLDDIDFVGIIEKIKIPGLLILALVVAIWGARRSLKLAKRIHHSRRRNAAKEKAREANRGV